MRVYKIGVIGFGGMAGHHYTQLHKKGYKRAKIKGVYDVNPERVWAAKKRGLIGYDSLESILADNEIDIILVATTNETHKELAVKSLRAGKHVICEKPVTISSDELLEIMSVAKETGKIFTIDQNRRNNKDFVLVKRSLKSGIIGEPYVIESRVEGSRGLPNGWRTKRALGGGMMLDWGVHLIDQIMHMINEKVVSVYCKMFNIEDLEVEDNFRLDVTFESGLLAHIEVSTNNYITHPRWYVLGKEGTLQIDSWDCDGKIVRCINKENKWDDDIIITKAGPTKTMAQRNIHSTETIQLSEPLDVEDNLNPVYDQIIDAIEGKAALEITAEQALRVMRVMEAAFESNKHQAIVKTSI